ncbi:hypothetical protein BH10PSE6_BH10PSE6_05140 [soil metagenome]
MRRTSEPFFQVGRTTADDWTYEHLFAKKDRANIEDDELKDFRILAKSYATLNEEQIARLLQDKDLTEICHANET